MNISDDESEKYKKVFEQFQKNNIIFYLDLIDKSDIETLKDDDENIILSIYNAYEFGQKDVVIEYTTNEKAFYAIKDLPEESNNEQKHFTNREYKARKKLEEAENVYRLALKCSEELYNEGWQTANILTKLAIILINLALIGKLLIDTKRLNEAKLLLERALQISINTLGPEHPDTKVIKEYLEKISIY